MAAELKYHKLKRGTGSLLGINIDHTDSPFPTSTLIQPPPAPENEGFNSDHTLLHAIPASIPWHVSERGGLEVYRISAIINAAMAGLSTWSISSITPPDTLTLTTSSWGGLMLVSYIYIHEFKTAAHRKLRPRYGHLLETEPLSVTVQLRSVFGLFPSEGCLCYSYFTVSFTVICH